MHERLYGPGHETVDEEEVLLDAKLCVQTFEVAGTIAFDSMAQRQVLGARRSADGVGLHKPQPVEGSFQRGWSEEATGDGEPSQVIQGDRHGQMLPKVRTAITGGLGIIPIVIDSGGPYQTSVTVCGFRSPSGGETSAAAPTEAETKYCISGAEVSNGPSVA